MADPTGCYCESCLGFCDDGMGVFSDCICPECSTDFFCTDPFNCTDDGLCDPYLEGCHCTDCATHIECSPPGGICGSGLVYAGNPSCNNCLSQTCCTSFDACLNDVACENCLLGTGVNCEANQLYTSFVQCQSTCPTCPAPICDTGYSIFGACASCLSTNCCADYQACENNANCDACILGTGGVNCGTDPLVAAVDACFTGTCGAQCQ